ncbi:MAG: hypothetical protein WD046_09260 [Paracoccaceae bacterium]
MKQVFLIAALLFGGVAQAQTAILPEEFGAAAIGKTYWFSENGIHYGAEQYFDDQTVIWQDRNGNCLRGSWYANGPQMCFIYDNDPAPDCWTMWETDDGRVLIESTRIPDDPAIAPLVLELIRRTPLPIACTGPLLGV